MSQLLEIQAAQKSLEDCFAKRMDELEAQIQSSGPAKDTVAKVAEEFRAFRELAFSMLGILRKQIWECVKMCDTMETRHRRKALVFSGFKEAAGEDCTALIAGSLHSTLGLKNFTVASIKTCHRLGSPSKDRTRPILVRFNSVEDKMAVWRAKKGFKGSSVSVKEFLTKPRQSVFGRARQHFGMRSCWTQDGIIVVKTPDGNRSKITSMDELNPLMAKYPKHTDGSSTAATSGAGSASSTGASSKNVSRKN